MFSPSEAAVTMDLTVKKKGSYDIDSLLGTETNVTMTTSPQRDVTEDNDDEKEDAGKWTEIKEIAVYIRRKYNHYGINIDM